MVTYVSKTPNTIGGWTWYIGQVALAYSYVTPQTEPGLFWFSINGVHQQGAELFSTPKRAEALLQKHLGGEVTFTEQAVPQYLVVARDVRWVKMQPNDPPEREQDAYTYIIGNIVLASLSNIKNIRLDGYHLHLSSHPARPPITKILSVTEGEQILIRALECTVEIQPRKIGYFIGPNHEPGKASYFAARPTLYSGRLAW